MRLEDFGDDAEVSIEVDGPPLVIRGKVLGLTPPWLQGEVGLLLSITGVEQKGQLHPNVKAPRDGALAAAIPYGNDSDPIQGVYYPVLLFWTDLRPEISMEEPDLWYMLGKSILIRLKRGRGQNDH